MPGLDAARAQADGIASSEEELCLVALFGDDARALIERVRGRDFPNAAIARTADAGEAERVRRLVEILEDSGAGELTVEDGGTRITVRKQEDQALVPVAVGRDRRPPLGEPPPRRPPASSSRARSSATSTARPLPASRRSWTSATASRSASRSACSRR